MPAESVMGACDSMAKGVGCLLFAVCCVLCAVRWCAVRWCAAVSWVRSLCSAKGTDPMPPFRCTPHLFVHRIARALFLLLWAAVLLVRCGAVDHRALQGNPARNAPRPPLAEEVI